MTQTGKDVAHLSGAAEDWVRWTRQPDHDAYWAYQGALQAFVGPGRGAGLEIGPGEGRVSRMLSGLGYRMTLAEPVADLLHAARQAGSGEAYIHAPGHDLPLEDGSFELLMLYNVLMDVDDLTATMSEAARVLAPGGQMVIGIVHPFADLMLSFRKTGDWAAQGAYFHEREFNDIAVDRGGLHMHFRGWHRPMSSYISAILSQGLRVTAMEEPRPDPNHAWSAGSRWQKLPLFLWIKAERPGRAR